MTVLDRFLKYITFDTQSCEESPENPSTAKQLILAKHLAEEMTILGIHDVSLDEKGYVLGRIPSNCLEKKIPAVGFLAHMDTSPELSGKDVNSKIIKNYDGNDILLNEELKIILSPKKFESLHHYIGDDLIVTDGTTLLGADDKAGIAEIMTMAEYFITHPDILHGDICIAFTPDEEIGRGMDFFPLEQFGAVFAYTVDGGELGELEYENFNAASVNVHIKGVGIHPGSAKNKMINALLVALQFQQSLPVQMRPEHTDGYDGFIHLHRMDGSVEEAKMQYLIRDHDMTLFNEKKERFSRIADFLNLEYGEDTVKVIISDSYSNMKEKILPHMELIDLAREVMLDLGITPVIKPIRGGTDGARLSYMGLPCPNLCTGGENFHGRYEYISIQSMEKITDILVHLASRFTTLV